MFQFLWAQEVLLYDEREKNSPTKGCPRVTRERGKRYSLWMHRANTPNDGRDSCQRREKEKAAREGARV